MTEPNMPLAAAQAAVETKTAPRVTLDGIKSQISEARYFFDGTLTICVIEMLNGFKAVGKAAPADERNFDVEIGKRYAYEDGAGEVGFVSSVTAPFCGDCHRARVSADGRLYTCLFAASGHDLRPLLADGEDAVAAHVAAVWARRSDRYSEIRSEAGVSRKHVEMYLVGG